MAKEAQLSIDLLERNLRALQSRQSDVAELLRESAIPDGVIPATGRDGTPTLMVAGPNGPTWLGGSSMPRVSAEEMFGNIMPHGGSVTLPAILTGMEAIVLTQRLAPRFAVFVVDRPEAFKLVLMLRDYGEPFAAGRIVFLLSDDLLARTKSFFSRNPGFALPNQVIKVPQVPAGDAANLVRVLEDAGAQALCAQQEFLKVQVNALRSLESNPLSETPCVAVLAADDGRGTIELTRRLKRALQNLNVPNELCIAVQPDQCHVAARVSAVVRSRAQVVLCLNGTTQQERSLFPPDLPVIDWRFSGPWAPRRGESFDLLVVESQERMRQAKSAGWPTQQVVVIEPCANLANENAAHVPPIGSKPSLGVLMDLPDDRPEASGVSLPSQVELWNSLQKEVLHRADRWSKSDAGKVLEAAQRSCGTVLADSQLLGSFEALLISHIAPATVARSLALVLVKNSFAPEIWGDHWPAMGRGADLRRGSIPDDVSCHELFSRPGVVVIPWFSHAGVQLAVDFLARESAVLMRGSQEEFTAEYPHLATGVNAIHWFQSSSTMISTLRDLIAHPDRTTKRSRAAAQHIREQHTLVHRLQALFQQVRNAQSKHRSKESI